MIDIKNLENAINVKPLEMTYECHDIFKFATLHAAFDSAKYFNTYMHKAQCYDNNLSLLTHAMNIRQLDGLILEFGVASGTTINHISSLTKQKVYGFDWFYGLPEDWRTGFDRGLFMIRDQIYVNNNIDLIVGLFEDSIDDFIKDRHEPISLLHIDCDLYSSTKTIFSKLKNHIIKGTVIVFDEYFNYPGWEHHEFKAFQEYVQSNNITYHYDSFVPSHQQVCLCID